MIDLVLRSVLTPGVLAARWAGIVQLPVTADVPATRWSIGLASKLILDEIFFLTEALSIRLISERDFSLNPSGDATEKVRRRSCTSIRLISFPSTRSDGPRPATPPP